MFSLREVNLLIVNKCDVHCGGLLEASALPLKYSVSRLDTRMRQLACVLTGLVNSSGLSPGHLDSEVG